MELLVTKERTGDTVRLSLRGEVDLATAGQIRDAVVEAVVQSRAASIVLDFAGVEFIDSTGIGELVSCHRAAAVSGAVLELVNLSPFTHRQLWATGLLGLFGLASSPA